MSSPKQIAANRRNAQRSTGPKTPAGKRTSSWNSLKHGLTAQYDLSRFAELVQRTAQKQYLTANDRFLKTIAKEG